MSGILNILASGAGGFSPLQVFSGGLDGSWYDFTDITTMFQNDNGTGAPVVNERIGYVADKSGNGNHIRQTNFFNRPFLRKEQDVYYLEFDDSFFVSNSINFTTTNKITVIGAVAKNTEESTGTIVQLAQNFTTTSTGSFSIRSHSINTTSGASAPWYNYDIYCQFGGLDNLASYASWCTTNVYPPLQADILTANFSSNAANTTGVQLRIDSQTATKATTSFTGASLTGSFSNNPIYIGSNGGIQDFFYGRMYGLIIGGKQFSIAERDQCETWLKYKLLYFDYTDDLLLQDGSFFRLNDGGKILIQKRPYDVLLLEFGESSYVLLEDTQNKAKVRLEETDDILLENGDFILYEDGGKMITEY